MTIHQCDSHTPPSRDVATLRRRLLAWFRRYHRTLPWRKLRPQKPNPYHVLVSEAMLQQTQVTTVVGYFRRFIVKWPTLTSLARANSQEVLRMWQGLGYYRRALYLHAAAQIIVRDGRGKVPRKIEDLAKLPGVGLYSAGAIASIAHGQCVPAVDANAARVLARLFAIGTPLDQPKVRSRLWQLAEQLVPAADPGEFNQALMEFGSMVCTPRNPRCVRCPMVHHCRAHRMGAVSRFPVRRPKAKPRPVEHHIIAACKRDRYLFEQRPANGLWSHMWQLPTMDHASDAGALKQWIKLRFGVVTNMPQMLATFAHQTSHRSLRFVVWSASVRAGRLRPNVAIWRKLGVIDDLPLANPQRRAIAILQGEE